MAPTKLTIQQLDALNGEDIAFVNADLVNGNQIQNTGRVVLLVKMPNSTSTVTVNIPSLPDAAGRVGDQSKAVPANTVESFGPYADPTIWGDGLNILITYSGTSGQATPQVAAVQI